MSADKSYSCVAHRTTLNAETNTVNECNTHSTNDVVTCYVLNITPPGTVCRIPNWQFPTPFPPCIACLPVPSTTKNYNAA